MTQGVRGKMCIMEFKGELLTLLVPISSSLQMPCLQQISQNGEKNVTDKQNCTNGRGETKTKKTLCYF